MSKKEISFKCLQCGNCCRGILKNTHNLRKGLSILPNERKLFASEKIQPALGIGNNPTHRRFRIIGYQMVIDVCEHLHDNQCGIYENRPVSCRAFPCAYQLGSDGRKYIGVDRSCKAISTITSEHPKVGIKFHDLEYAEKLLSIEMEALLQPHRAWYFDLNGFKWKRLE